MESTKSKSKWPILISIAVAIAIVIYTQITLFIIQPLGMLPEGKTLVMLRMNKTKFIDSADAICEREMGGVNLICRMGMLAGIGSKGVILLRLPYSESLYLISTNGVSYDR